MQQVYADVFIQLYVPPDAAKGKVTMSKGWSWIEWWKLVETVIEPMATDIAFNVVTRVF